MDLEELKKMLEEGKITQAQFESMVKALGLDTDEPDKDEPDKDEPDDKGGLDEKLIEKKIQQAVDRATNKLGNENKKLRESLDKLKKEKLTEEELKALEDAEKEKTLAEREAAVKAAENRMYAIKAIKKAGLDDGSETALEILEVINGKDEETIDANIKALKAVIDKLVKAEVDKTFKENGRNPDKGGSGGNGENPYLPDSFNLTKQMELETNNPELAKKLKAAAGLK